MSSSRKKSAANGRTASPAARKASRVSTKETNNNWYVQLRTSDCDSRPE